MPPVTLEELRSVYVLKDLPDEHLQWLLDHSRYYEMQDGECLVRTGEPIDEMMLIIEGKVSRGAKTRVMRGDKVIGTGTISSLRRFKEDVKDVEKGFECGLSVEGVKSVTVKMDSDVPNDGRMRGLVKMPIRNAIAVGSGKGGVGKSTIAVNLAVALAQAGARVGLMDVDIYGPNVPTMLGVEKLPPPNGKRLIPAIAYGFKMISMGLLVKPGQPLI